MRALSFPPALWPLCVMLPMQEQLDQRKSSSKILGSECSHILIIHAAECISSSATCIEDIYNDANRTSRGGGGGGGGGEFGLHNIVNVRNHVATPLMHEE